MEERVGSKDNVWSRGRAEGERRSIPVWTEQMMSTTRKRYGKWSVSWTVLVGGVLLFVGALILALVALTWKGESDRGTTLVVYCAAGIKPPVVQNVLRWRESQCVKGYVT